MARRLPIYLLLDVSGSMAGEPIAAVQNGVQTMVNSLLSDPQAIETVYASVITFSNSAKQIVPLTELPSFKLPQLTAGGMTSLGEALTLVAQCIDREVIKNTPEVKGDFKPLVFILTDGCATDDVEKGLEDFHKKKFGRVIACGAGSNADTKELLKITETVVTLDTVETGHLQQFFKWASASVVLTTVSIQSENAKKFSSDQLPPPPPEIHFL